VRESDPKRIVEPLRNKLLSIDNARVRRESRRTAAQDLAANKKRELFHVRIHRSYQAAVAY
jgi:hypothetical protein